MACTEKRRITTNLLQVALVLLFLRGELPWNYNHRQAVNSGSSEYMLGPSWGYAQTNFHRNNGYGAINVHPKSLHSFEQNFVDFNNDDLLDVLRSHSINSFRSHISAITKVSKTIPSFQNVTAYLVSNSNTSTSVSNPAPPAHLERPALILSVNADVPSSSDELNRNIASIEETNADGYLESENDLSQENVFNLISGNILFLPEATDEDIDNSETELLDETYFPTDNSDNEINLLKPEGENETSNGYATSVLEESEGLSWSLQQSPPEQSGRLWDQLQNDMGQLDEEFSLGLALDDDALEFENLLSGHSSQSRFTYVSEDDDDVTMEAIPPMALHFDSESVNENGNQTFDSSVSELLDAVNTDWGEVEIEDDAVSLESLIDSGIFEALLESPAEQPSTSTVFEDLESESSSSSKSVQAFEEISYLSGGSVVDSSDEDSNSDLNGLDMIQTASIYANARPNPHAPQPRGFQVHARMQGLLRGSSMDQRWQELASLLSLQPQHDPSGAPLPPPLPHHFPPHHHHHHHHLHHPSSSLHHHSMHHHHPPFSTAGPSAVPYPDTSRSVLLQNASLPVPPPEINPASSYQNVSMGPPPNLGSALASSMHLTNSSDPMIDPSSHYKMIEPSHHDMIYYPNMTSNAEMSNQTTEGFLSSILNDDDLQLMDMAMNEGMYTMRLMDNSSGPVGSNTGGNAGPVVGIHQVLPHPSTCAIGAAGASAVSEDRMEASSDSAVSSMGSERVPPMTDPHMSDTEWTDPDAHPHSSHESNYSSDYASKLRSYEYYGKSDSIHRVVTPVAQKKHQMFGKRVQHDQGIHPYPVGSHPASGLGLPYPSTSGAHPSNNASVDPLEMKYSCSVDFVRHDSDGRPEVTSEVHSNHSYSLPQSHLSNSALSLRTSRQPVREKPKKEYLSRDEKRARSMSLPMTTDDIINLPMDEFNERLSKYDLSEAQLSLIRDIRRRGKNKVAAQNCRKRKLDQILQLADEVQKIRDRKHNLLREQEGLLSRRNNLKEKYSQLYRTVFQALRDRDGNPYSPYEYSLQQAADGNIILVPRHSIQPSSAGSSDSVDPSMRRGKSKDEIKKDGQA